MAMTTALQSRVERLAMLPEVPWGGSRLSWLCCMVRPRLSGKFRWVELFSADQLLCEKIVEGAGQRPGISLSHFGVMKECH